MTAKKKASRLSDQAQKLAQKLWADSPSTSSIITSSSGSAGVMFHDPDPTIPSQIIPTGISVKDVPQIEFKFATMNKHPLQDKRIWRKTTEFINDHEQITYKMSIHTMRNYKDAGEMIMPTINDPVLPHPTDNSMIIYADDFESGFVRDDITGEISYWKIQCKNTGIYIVMDNS